jgi:hypothetical protein
MLISKHHLCNHWFSHETTRVTPGQGAQLASRTPKAPLLAKLWRGTWGKRLRGGKAMNMGKYMGI